MTQKIITSTDNATYKIIGACMDVHNDLGPGHREIIYHIALSKKFIELGISFVDEPELPVHNEQGNVLLVYKPDFLVESQVC